VESSSSALGLIAGSTQMPVVVAEEARRAGREVHVAAIRGITEPAIDEVASNVVWLDWGDLPAFFALLQQWQGAGVREAIMAGKVEQRVIYDEETRQDAELQDLLAELPSGHTDQLLGAVANVLESAQIRLLASTRYLQTAIATPGRLAGRSPDDRERADVAHGWQVAKALGGLDIGQTVVVKERAVVAVEAMEGTDACIRRAGELAGPGCVVVKVGKPDQDLRFDVPVVGLATVASLAAAGASVLAVEAGVTVVFDRERIERRCDELGISVVAHERD
jgi:DUF1009 family protein